MVCRGRFKFLIFEQKFKNMTIVCVSAKKCTADMYDAVEGIEESDLWKNEAAEKFSSCQPRVGM